MLSADIICGCPFSCGASQALTVNWPPHKPRYMRHFREVFDVRWPYNFCHFAELRVGTTVTPALGSVRTNFVVFLRFLFSSQKPSMYKTREQTDRRTNGRGRRIIRPIKGRHNKCNNDSWLITRFNFFAFIFWVILNFCTGQRRF